MGRASAFLFLALLPSVVLQCAAQQAAAEAYTPKVTSCPSTPLVRSAGRGQQSLNAQEAEYIRSRKSSVLPHSWKAYLANVEAHAKANKVTLPSYISRLLGSQEVSDGLTLGIAVSGGGYRAATFGAGVLGALDGRNTTSVRAGTGGLLQGASYLSALSGGAWLSCAWMQANNPLFPSLVFGGDSTNSSGSSDTYGGWITPIDLVEVSSDPTVEEQFVETLIEEVSGKFLAGYPVTVGDVWARTLARHFVNGTTVANFFNTDITHGAGLTWSSVPNLPSFADHMAPLPIIMADTISAHQNPSEIIPGDEVPITNPIYEVTPYEFGSYDPMLGSFIPTKFLGSTKGKCVTGYDQTSYIAAISSDLFNSDNNPAIDSIAQALNASLPQPGVDLEVAVIPNPFIGIAEGTFPDSNEPFLQLVDGGEDGEVVPLQPLLVKARNLDVIVAIDASADTEENFTNGSSIIATQKRAKLFSDTYSFPSVPTDPSTFVTKGLTKRPTFFGCSNAGDAPLVIYIANGGAPLGQTPVTNVPTGQTNFPAAQIQSILDQTFDTATQGIPIHTTEKDPEWPSCLACAVVDRARAKAGIPRTGVCESCLNRYCFS